MKAIFFSIKRCQISLEDDSQWRTKKEAYNNETGAAMIKTFNKGTLWEDETWGLVIETIHDAYDNQMLKESPFSFILFARHQLCHLDGHWHSDYIFYSHEKCACFHIVAALQYPMGAQQIKFEMESKMGPKGQQINGWRVYTRLSLL